MSIAGKWQLTVNTPMGKQTPVLTLDESGNGGLNSPQGDVALNEPSVDGNTVTAKVTLKVMGQNLPATVKATVDGDSISGEIQTGMGNSSFSGNRA